MLPPEEKCGFFLFVFYNLSKNVYLRTIFSNKYSTKNSACKWYITIFLFGEDSTSPFTLVPIGAGLGKKLDLWKELPLELTVCSFYFSNSDAKVKMKFLFACVLKLEGGNGLSSS